MKYERALGERLLQFAVDVILCLLRILASILNKLSTLLLLFIPSL
ncbi:MAG: hypothetical protein ABII90_03195 [Bacteroidota bacterium]